MHHVGGITRDAVTTSLHTAGHVHVEMACV